MSAGGIRGGLAIVVACAALTASAAPSAPEAALVVTPTPTTRTQATPRQQTVAMEPLYPWGRDHNGTARMYAEQVSTVDGVTTLTAVRDLTQSPPISDHRSDGVDIPIHYRSGAVHSVKPVTILDRAMRISVEAQLPSTFGTWPAIWLTGVDVWPPEIDVAEYLGSNQVLQNVFSTTKHNSVHIPTRVTDTENWHTYTAEITPYTNGDVLVQFFIDGKACGSVTGDQLVGKKLWLIANLQMERWSGAPGPDRAVMRFRDLVVS